MEAAHFRVEDLGDELPPPPVADEPTTGAGAWEDLEPASDEDVAWLASRLVSLAKAPFELAALRLGPHWRVSDEEVRPIVDGVLDSIPRTSLTEQLVERAPLIAAVIQAGGLVRVRIAETRRLAALAVEAQGEQQQPIPFPVRPPAAPPPVEDVERGAAPDAGDHPDGTLADVGQLERYARRF